MATKEDIKEKLNVIGLDLDNLPEFLQKVRPIVFNPSRLNNDKELKVYKYVSISDIEIYCTPAYRDDAIKEKYDRALPLAEYIRKSEEDTEKSRDLLNAFDRISSISIKRIENEQKKMREKIPFTVHYHRSQLWQVYYSQDTNRYFMLVSLKEQTFDEFFYLLKKKIELDKSGKDEKIFIPISYVNYSEKFLTNKQINDIENYLWVFTKNWCLTYEVYDEKENLSLQIVGDTPIYDNLKSMYKIIIKTPEEALDFYNLSKALFILQTELDGRYIFQTQIDNDNKIEFFYKDKKLLYKDMPEFIKTEYIETEAAIKKFNQESFKLEKKLKNLKEECRKLDSEYFIKQKQISLYLECKKTFLGKVKYFFSKKKINKILKEEKEYKEEKIAVSKEPKPIQGFADDKKYHAIDDLVAIQALYEKSEKYVKDLNHDIAAIELKIKHIKKKIENATTYLNEIDEHKKSLFDFWKFANKDEMLELESGSNDKDIIPLSIKKKFDYDYDFEDLGIYYDKLERTKFSKSELDGIFIATTNVLPVINMIKDGEMNKDVIDELLRNLKSEYFTTLPSSAKNDFDIFGSMKEDSTLVRYLNNKAHRENEKDKFQILNINKKIDIFDFTEKLNGITNSLKESMHKIKTNYDLPIYKIVAVNEKLHQNDYNIFDINIERELASYENKFETSVKMLKLNFKEQYPIIFLSNAVYYDNSNNTLPAGMDITSKVLIDANMFEFELVDKTKIKTNRYFNDYDSFYPKLTQIYIEEYDIKLKDNAVNTQSEEKNKQQDNDSGKKEKDRKKKTEKKQEKESKEKKEQEN